MTQHVILAPEEKGRAPTLFGLRHFELIKSTLESVFIAGECRINEGFSHQLRRGFAEIFGVS